MSGNNFREKLIEAGSTSYYVKKLQGEMYPCGSFWPLLNSGRVNMSVYLVFNKNIDVLIIICDVNPRHTKKKDFKFNYCYFNSIHNTFSQTRGGI